MLTIAEALKCQGPLWFPGLAEHLADRFDARAGAMLTANYRTSRWLSHSEPGGEETEAVVIGSRIAVLENLATAISTKLSVTPIEWDETSALQLQAAFSLLGQIPGLTLTLASLVRAIHRLDALPDYDLSHSDPGLPYSIFVSVPPQGGVATLRLAESILHEAMHLQLTLVEREIRLIADQTREGWSPWQGCARPTQGLLHGLYVFAVIFELFGELDRSSDWAFQGNSKAICDYLRRRRFQIVDEVRALPDFSKSLEPAGQRLRKRCLDAIPIESLDNLESLR